MGVRELVDAAKSFAAQGRVDNAQAAYLAALQHDPTDVHAMTGLGMLLAASGRLGGARTVLEETVRLHPDHADAYRGLVLVCSALGDQAAADEYSRREFALRPTHVTPFTGVGTPVRLLLLVSAAGKNTRTARFRDSRLFETITVAPEYIDDISPLPDHDIVFNAIGDVDGAPAALAAARRLVARTTRRVFNHPAVIGATSRIDNAARLADIPGVVTAAIQRVRRDQFADPTLARTLAQSLARELGVPFLVRAPGYHTGEYFERIDDPAHLAAALGSFPGDEFLAMSFLDARDAFDAREARGGRNARDDRDAGKTREPDITRDTADRYRKFRMMIVDGKLYPLHAAVGPHWKLHFQTGTHGEEERALDQAFLTDPVSVIGPRAYAALEAIAERLELDYGGIDFALDRAGNVLVFEANATMMVPEADADPLVAYRNAALNAVADAVMRMFMNGRRAGSQPELRPGVP